MISLHFCINVKVHNIFFGIQPIKLSHFVDLKIINNLFQKKVVGRNAIECELFYFHFRFPRFSEYFLKNSEKLPPWNGK